MERLRNGGEMGLVTEQLAGRRFEPGRLTTVAGEASTQSLAVSSKRGDARLPARPCDMSSPACMVSQPPPWPNCAVSSAATQIVARNGDEATNRRRARDVAIVNTAQL